MSWDVVDLITQDHREVERLFDELRTHSEKRALLVPVLTSILIAHSRAEESEVYPVARQEADEADEVEHSQEEHAEAEQLLAHLATLDPGSGKFDDALREVIDAVTHHVEEEESNVLPGMRQRLDERRREELGRAFAAARAKHMGDRPGEASKQELLTQARNAGVSGAASMSKDELAAELRPST